MGARVSVVLGLLAGLVTAGLLFAALVAFAPEQTPAATPPTSADLSPSPLGSPSPAPTASPAASPSPAPTESPAASPSPAPTGSPSPTESPLSTASPAPTESFGASGDTGFMIGQAAPALVVPQVGGGTIDLAALKGKPVWLNLMATWCPPCRDELPLMNGFATRYASTGLVVVAVDVREDEGTVAPYMDSLGVTFPVGLDADGSAQTAWRAAALPVHYWIDASGIIRDGAAGAIGPDVMAAGLETILPGVDVTP